MRTAFDVETVRAAERALMARLPEGALMQRAAAGLAAACADLLGKVYGARVVLLTSPHYVPRQAVNETGEQRNRYDPGASDSAPTTGTSLGAFTVSDLNRPGSTEVTSCGALKSGLKKVSGSPESIDTFGFT